MNGMVTFCYDLKADELVTTYNCNVHIYTGMFDTKVSAGCLDKEQCVSSKKVDYS